ncbi:hypothetical protein [Croceicoccus estronivorus]|uniref:hypothetical protein n=1 Tax=Croceicoccus estronivorus TaxID=1172626 RepID=UPI000B203744|nr:hypothetical protein [Croceicoccus estronivorus]
MFCWLSGVSERVPQTPASAAMSITVHALPQHILVQVRPDKYQIQLDLNSPDLAGLN